MTTVTVPGNLEELLAQLKEEAELRDGSGNLLGYFTPREQARAKLYAKARALIDPVEMKRRKETEHGKGLTLEQVMERIRSLEASG